MSSFADRARDYAIDVVEGRIPACRYVQLACHRHLDDLARVDDPGFPWVFDEAQAQRVCAFKELLPHIKGDWAREGELFRHSPHQVFITCSVFGWVSRTTGLRRFWRVYLEIPRKNGKSTDTAANGLYMFAADGEHGAEVYSGAGTEKQAWEVFGPARLMALKTPDLVDAFGIRVGAKNLHIIGTASKFEPVIGKPGDGSSPSFAITDEYHEHATDDQYDTMVTGMGSRTQPIAWVITTAGSDIAGPCYALRQEVVAMLEGTVPNEGLFGMIFTIDEGDDWTSPEALRKANPNMGVSVSETYLLTQQRDAVQNARKQATFKTKHLNVWVTASSPFFNLELWNRLADPGLLLEDFHGEACWAGLDLASKLDLCAAVKVFRGELEDGTHWYAFLDAYLPEEQAQDPTLSHYAGWVEQGHLTATPGNITDYGYIEDDLLALSEEVRFMEIGYDPLNATQLATRLMDQGLPMVEVAQNVKFLSEPMKWIEALIVDGRLHHDGNPVFAWGMSNVTAKLDRNENVFPRKEKVENKIDPAVALIIAMSRALAGEPAESVYESRGLLDL
jgi:phage terminase large subunit-like protein